MKLIYGYTRSTRIGYGISTQEKILNKYAKDNGYKIILYSDLSNGTSIGTGLNRLLSNIIPNTTLIMTDEKRLSQNKYYLELLIKEFKNKNINIIYVTKDIIDMKDIDK